MPSDAHYEGKIEEARRRSEADDKVSIKDLAAELGVSVRTLRRWNKRPDATERVKWGRKHMYRRADVKHWLEAARGYGQGLQDDHARNGCVPRDRAGVEGAEEGRGEGERPVPLRG